MSYKMGYFFIKDWSQIIFLMIFCFYLIKIQTVPAAFELT